jgi:hypothetical protein
MADCSSRTPLQETDEESTQRDQDGHLFGIDPNNFLHFIAEEYSNYLAIISEEYFRDNPTFDRQLEKSRNRHKR